MNVEQTSAQTFYDDVWQNYGELDAVSPAAFHRRRIVVELALRYAAHAQTILDVGSGQGQLLAEIAEEFPKAKLYGADVSPESLAETARKNPRASVVPMDLCAPDFERRHAERLGTFDLVVCSEVLEHLDAPSVAVVRLRSLLSASGRLLITVPGGKMSRFDRLIGHQRHYDVSALEALLKSAQLAPMEVMAWGFPFQNLYRSAVRIASRAQFSKVQTTPKKPRVNGILSAGYNLFGKALKPLFYLNRPYWGEQLFAVARRVG